MALFGRRSDTTPPASSSEPRPTVGSNDLASAQTIMNQWDASLGNSDATWAVIEAIARRGGFKGSQAALMEIMDGKPADVVTTRPWRWWAEASRVAGTEGDHQLVGQIFMFAHLFVNQTLPRMRPVDEMETGLGKPDETSYWTIARNAAEAFRHLPQNMLIHDTATGKVDVANARRLACQVANLPEDHGELAVASANPVPSFPSSAAPPPTPETNATLPPPDNTLHPGGQDTPVYRCRNTKCRNHGETIRLRQCPECFHYAQAE